MWWHSFLPWEGLENHLPLMLIIIIKKGPLSGYKSCHPSQKCRSSECWGWQVWQSHICNVGRGCDESEWWLCSHYVIPSQTEQDQQERKVGGLRVTVTVHWSTWGLGKWGSRVVKSVQKALERIQSHLQDGLCLSLLIRVCIPSDSWDKKQLVKCHLYSVCDSRVLEYTFDSSKLMLLNKIEIYWNRELCIFRFEPTLQKS